MIQQHRNPVEDYPQQSGGTQEPLGSKACSQLKHYVEENPTAAVVLGFGAGLGLGVALAYLMRESVSHFSHEDSFAERVSNSVRESVQEMLPKSWKNRLHA